MNKKDKTIIAILLILAIICIAIFILAFNNSSGSSGKGFTGFSLNSLTGNAFKEDKAEQGSIDAYFCQTENCTKALVEFLNNSRNPKCAFYDLNLKEVIKVMEEKNGVLIIDNENDLKINKMKISKKISKKKDSDGLMHNKFCVYEDYVITGSMNPTYNDAYRNDNNLIIIKSKTIAENYENEFDEMFSGTFKKGKKVKRSGIIITSNNRNITVENYFCPEDNCAYNIIKNLKKANESIYFMTFSFTHDGITKTIIEGMNKKNIRVKGVYETKQMNEFTDFEKLKNSGALVKEDDNEYNMHHKVFIIDKKIVITGSMNPSNNGDKNNDENVIIIHDSSIAQEFVEEFERVYGLS